jgi:DNA-binding SARP family transcriptional activator
MARLTLTFFGSFQASLNGKGLTNFRSPRMHALLAYLVLEAARPHTRETLAGLFWPDEPNQTAKQNLRQALYQLRQLLAEQHAPFLLVTRDTVQFNPTSDYVVDVATFVQALQQG